VDEDFEMIAIELKGRDPNFTWEIIDIYRAPNDYMGVVEYWQPELIIQEILQSVASLG
jgi:hypothetical protein